MQARDEDTQRSIERALHALSVLALVASGQTALLCSRCQREITALRRSPQKVRAGRARAHGAIRDERGRFTASS